MDKRLAKLDRLVRLQRRMEDVVEAELAEVSRAQSALAENIADCYQAMSSDDPARIRFGDLFASRIDRLQKIEREVEAHHERLVVRLHGERAKGDRLEERRERLGVEVDRLREDDAVLDIIEILDAQASRKLAPS